MPLKLYRPEGYIFGAQPSAHLEIDPERLTFTVRGLAPGGGGQGGATVMTWSGLRNHPARFGFDRWVVPMNPDLSHDPVINLHVETYLTRFNAYEWVKERGKQVLLHVLTRPEDTSFLEAFVMFYAPQNMTFTSNLEHEVSPHIVHKGPKTYWPHLVLAALSRDGDTQQIGVEMRRNVNEEIYLSADCGVVPRKINVVNGIGQFPFVMTGMSPGQTTEVSAGFRLFDKVARLVVAR